MSNTTDSANAATAALPLATWFAVYPCGWKLDIGNDTRATEQPVAIFKFRSSADEYAQTGWPGIAEVRPHAMDLISANERENAKLRDALETARGGLCVAAIKDGTLAMIDAALANGGDEQRAGSAATPKEKNTL